MFNDGLLPDINISFDFEIYTYYSKTTLLQRKMIIHRIPS